MATTRLAAKDDRRPPRPEPKLDEPIEVDVSPSRIRDGLSVDIGADGANIESVVVQSADSSSLEVTDE